MVDNHKIPVYWPSNMNNEYESEWKYDSKQDKVINMDSASIILIISFGQSKWSSWSGCSGQGDQEGQGGVRV